MKNFEIHKKQQFPNNHSTLDAVEILIEEIKNRYNLSNETYYNILIAISEAVNNAMTHGNKMDPNKLISFELFANPHELEIVVQDQGSGFDPTTIEDCTTEDNLFKDSGRGIYIMKSLCDNLEIISSENGTTFVLHFKY